MMLNDGFAEGYGKVIGDVCSYRDRPKEDPLLRMEIYDSCQRI